VDRDLFEALRGLRRQLAEARQWQPYLVFSDATLRELARVRPSSLERLRLVYGIGDTKLRDFGAPLLQLLTEHCRRHGLSTDNASAAVRTEEPRKPAPRPNPTRDLAFQLFRQQVVVEDVMHQTGRGRSTVMDYLCDWIREERPRSVTTWVSHEIYGRVADAARQLGTDRLKPIFIALGERVSYDEIRVVVAHLLASSPS
jgi:ATP-dependent DNA helicase RecQ